MDSLVTPAWLAERSRDDGVVILDASAYLPSAGRDAAAEFMAAHIPGALFLSLGTLTDPGSDVPKALPTGEQLTARLAPFGIAHDQQIVLYDDSAMRSSARAWFILRRAGIKRVAILDGGLAAWRSGGHPIESGAAKAKVAAIALSAPDRNDESRIRSKAQMLENCTSGREQVVDARDAGRFSGEIADAVHGLEGGHIPGALNLPFGNVLDSEGRFKSQAEIHAAFANAGVNLEGPITASCGSGMTASVLLFALHLIGRGDAALYDGSWSEWGADPEMPKETGPAC